MVIWGHHATMPGAIMASAAPVPLIDIVCLATHDAGSAATSVNGDRLGAGHGAVWMENAGFDLDGEGSSILGSEDGSQPYSGRTASGASSIRRHISM